MHKQLRPELLGLAQIMYNFLAIDERIHTVGDGTFTSSHLIANILCRLLILIPVKSASIQESIKGKGEFPALE